MAISYADWATNQDILDFLAKSNVTHTLLVADDELTMRRDGWSATIEQETKRQFVKGSTDEIRFFDGSGTAEVEVDDYIDATLVRVIQFGLVTQGFIVDNFFEPDTRHYPKTRIYLGQGNRPWYGNFFLNRFPEGYANIEVTAQWGYGATIPKDVWYAHIVVTAADIANSFGITEQGKPQRWTEGDVSESFFMNLPGDAAGWDAIYKKAIKLHKRPAMRHTRSNVARVL